jgi:hypothetical protein
MVRRYRKAGQSQFSRQVLRIDFLADLSGSAQGIPLLQESSNQPKIGAIGQRHDTPPLEDSRNDRRAPICWRRHQKNLAERQASQERMVGLWFAILPCRHPVAHRGYILFEKALRNVELIEGKSIKARPR